VDPSEELARGILRSWRIITIPYYLRMYTGRMVAKEHEAHGYAYPSDKTAGLVSQSEMLAGNQNLSASKIPDEYASLVSRRLDELGVAHSMVPSKTQAHQILTFHSNKAELVETVMEELAEKITEPDLNVEVEPLTEGEWAETAKHEAFKAEMPDVDESHMENLVSQTMTEYEQQLELEVDSVTPVEEAAISEETHTVDVQETVSEQVENKTHEPTAPGIEGEEVNADQETQGYQEQQPLENQLAENESPLPETPDQAVTRERDARLADELEPGRDTELIGRKPDESLTNPFDRPLSERKPNDVVEFAKQCKATAESKPVVPGRVAKVVQTITNVIKR